MARLRNMVPDGRRTAFYLLACFINSQMLSAANNKITGCFPVVRGMAARTPITVNNRVTNERWELVLKPKQGRYTFRGSKNDFQLKKSEKGLGLMRSNWPTLNDLLVSQHTKILNTIDQL